VVTKKNSKQPFRIDNRFSRPSQQIRFFLDQYMALVYSEVKLRFADRQKIAKASVFGESQTFFNTTATVTRSAF
jgi:hypothetical protein